MLNLNLEAIPNSHRRIKTIFFSLLVLHSICNAQIGYKWNSVSIGGGGFVSSLIMHPIEKDLIYARTDVGGAYRWNAANSSWIPLNDWASENETGYLGIESFASDPQSPNKFYMLMGISYFNGGRTAILRSTDYGNTFSITDVSTLFKAHGNGMGRQTGEKLQVDPNNGNILYCGSRRNGLFKSIDSGANWVRVGGLNITSTPNDNGVSFVFIDPSSGAKGSASQTIYVGISRSATPNMFVSRDGGATFNPLVGAPSNGFMPQRVSVSNDGIMYINYANGAGPHGSSNGSEPMTNGAIMKLNTKNGNWSNVTPSGIARAWGGISVDRANPNRVIASTIHNYQLQGNQGYGDRIYLSTNGGSSWTDVVARGHTMDPNGCTWISGHAIHWAGCVEFDPFDSKKVMITSGNGIFSNSNVDVASTPWKFNIKGLEETVPLDFISIPNGPEFSVIGDYDGFKHTDPSQYAPIHNPRTGTSTGIAFAALNTSKLLRVGNEMFYSINQGVSWSRCTSNGLKGKVAISADGTTFLHCPESSSTTYRSTNNGSSWTTVSGLSIMDGFPKADPVNSSKFYSYNNSNGIMYVSTNEGVSFTAAGNPGSGGNRRIEVAPGKEGHLWVPLYNGGLSRSTNSGQTFTKINGVTTCTSIGLGKPSPGATYFTIYIWGTVNNVKGMYRSINEGASWVRINDDAHEFGGPGNGQFVVGDQDVFGRVYMSTAGRGIAYAEIPLLTDLESESLTGANTISSSLRYFPNPFEGALMISLEGSFQYWIYDLSGHEVEQGERLHAANIAENLSPGTYLLKVQDGNRSSVVKIHKR